MSGNAKLTSTAGESLPSTGPTSSDTETCATCQPNSSAWMLFAADFHASPSALQESSYGKMTSVGFGLTLPPSFAWYDRATRLLRTYQACLTGGWAMFSGTWPRCGLMRNGTLYPLKPSAHPNSANESGLLRLPTLRHNDAEKRGNINHDDKRNGYPAALRQAYFRPPTIGANEYKGSARDRYRGSANFHGAKMSEGLRTCSEDPIYLNPCFGEVVMGYPIGWTELTPSETPLSHKS